MGWFTREGRRGSDQGAGTVADEQGAGPAPSGAPEASVRGRYGPRVHISSFEDGADELAWQVPVSGELHRVLPGPDRPDYSLMVLEQPLYAYPGPSLPLESVPEHALATDRRGRPVVAVHALVVCARYVGEQMRPGMRDLAVNVAYVLDPSVADDPVLDFRKIAYAAVGRVTEGLPPGPAEVDEAVARALVAGIAEHRGGDVSRVAVTLDLDADGHVTGLAGNADGAAPEPTPETFDRVEELVQPLRRAHGALPRSLRVRLDGDGLRVHVAPSEGHESARIDAPEAPSS